MSRLLRAFVLLAPLLAGAPAHAAPGQGDAPPPQVGTTLGGDPVLLHNDAGVAAVVSFWATWCPYCIKELPILSNIQVAAGKGRMRVIAVNVESRDVFRRASRLLDKLNVELAYDPDGKGQAAYGVSGIPHMIVVGRDGRIVQVFTGYSEKDLDAITAAINRAIGAAE